MHVIMACLILSGSANEWFFLPALVASFAISFGVRYARFFPQWVNGLRGGDWPPFMAVVDVVSVVVQTENGRYGERIVGYLATLTYFYRNPELQMGEYSRMFDREEEAQAWAASYKGRTVTVHVDPRDVSRSVLRKEEL
jgi:hypothetical protein